MDRYFQVFKKHSDYEEYINSGGGVDTYKAATNWKSYASAIEAIPT